jgi:hypothetical protein
LPTVRADFFLDPAARLTEQERALMTAMLTDLVATIADEFTTILADAEPANDEGDQLLDRLWASGLLDIPELVALLLRRSEEERIAAGLRAAYPGGKPRFLQSLVSDEDPEVSAAAMAVILARGRRRDRFDGPRLVFDDLPAEAAVSLVSAIAAALRSDLSRRLGQADSDQRLSETARALVARHDEANRLEAKLFDLVHALERAGRIDEQLIRSAVVEGEVSLLVEVLARRSGIDFDCAWARFSGGGGLLALLLRMGGVSRDLAGEIIAAAAELVGSDAESEIQEYDRLDDAAVERSRKWLRLDPAYRSAIEFLGERNGEQSL